MKRAFVVFLAVLFACRALGAEEPAKNLSPYFLVTGDPSVDQFPLLGTMVNASIAGVVSEVEVKQVYKNNGKKTIEAVYVFPLGVRSAIHAMRMAIGERTIEARIEEREAP